MPGLFRGAASKPRAALPEKGAPMKAPAFARLLALFCILFALTGAVSALAEDLTVEHDPAEGNFATIHEAIDEAERRLHTAGSENLSFRVVVSASPDRPYHGPIRPIPNVPIIGESTSGTIIDGGSQTLIEVRDVSNVTIRNFTFRNATVAISVANSDDVEITNNVFELGRAAGRTAILLQDVRNTEIVNNTFFNSDTAISTTSDVVITNNIFANNQTAIFNTVPLSPTYNLFFGNTIRGVEPDPTSIPNPPGEDADPRFVDSDDGDFHLRDDSAAKGAGNTRYPNSFDGSFDMGAYGGPDADIPPTGVTGLSATFAPPGTVTLNWTPSSSTAVTAYRVYYSYHGTEASEGPSPITIPGRTTASATLSGLSATPQPPRAPSLSVASRNEALQLDWDKVNGASGYRIYYSTAEFMADSPPAGAKSIVINDPETTTHTIPGLVNGTPYYVAIQAVANNTLSVAVTSVIDPALPSNPGSANESGYSRTSVTLGEAVEVAGALSAVILESPEPVIPYPALNGEGCFIATAAYGFYSAPQVQLLRDFRDRYLMPHAPGRAFVSWYYRYGPAGAAFMNRHPWLKPPVRLALFPLVALSFFLVKTPWTLQLLLAIFAGGCVVVSRRRRSRHDISVTAGRASEGGAA